MRIAGLDRGYERLTGSERFQLFVAAQARGDSAELERLFRSCPRVTVTQRDPAFTDRHERAVQLVVAVVATLDVFKGKLDVLAAGDWAAKIMFARAAEEAEFEALDLTGDMQPKVRRAVRSERGRLRNLLRHLRNALRTEAASVAHGFAAACHDELGVDPHQLINTVIPDEVELFGYFLGLSPDPELVETTKQSLIELWRLWVDDHPPDGRSSG